MSTVKEKLNGVSISAAELSVCYHISTQLQQC